MKKYLMILVAIVGFGLSAIADGNATCKISGTDNGTVEVSVYDNGDGTATVSFSNDSERYVNVQYSVGANPGSKLVPPQSSTSIKVKNTMGTAVTVSVSGARCQK